jgi:hypothetical protein
MTTFFSRHYTGYGIYTIPHRAPFRWVAWLMGLSYARQRRYGFLGVSRSPAG